MAPSRGWLAALLAASVVLVLGLTTPVPSEDGVSYLWIAERFAAWDLHAATSTVFPPGFPLLVAPWVALGLPAELAALLLNAGCTAATVFPLARLAARGHAEAAWPAMLLFAASSPLLLRVAAEAYSEPPYLLLMAWGTWLGFQRRWWAAGACSALAFWIRPEGVLLAGSFFLVTPRVAWRAVVAAGVGVLALALVHWSMGHGFDPLPIHAFHEQRDDLPERGAWLANMLQMPGGWIEAYLAAGVLVLWPWCQRLRAVWSTHESGPGMRGRLLAIGSSVAHGWSSVFAWQILGQLVAIASFVARKRFFLSCAVPVLAIAAGVLAAWPQRWRRVALSLMVLGGLLGTRSNGITKERAAERGVGLWLASTLPASAVVVGDLPRVIYYAGRPPLAPRHHTPAQMLAIAGGDDVAVVVLRERMKDEQKANYEAVLAGLAEGFERLPLPPEVARSAGERGIAVFRRR